MTPSFLDPAGLRLLLFGGKGGVGKTTCAVATALHWALTCPDDDFLLVSTDPAHSLNDSLAGSPPPGNLHIRELDAARSLRGFRAEHGAKLEEIARRGTFLDDEEITRFLALSLPGLDELMAFLEICRLQAEGRYRAILVDTAPTGHTLRLLTLPESMGRWLDMLDSLLSKHRYMKEVFSGHYEQDAIDRFVLHFAGEVEALGQLLRDPQHCRFVPVMLAETLSLKETDDLLAVLAGHGINTPEIVVNRLIPANDCPNCIRLRNRQSVSLASPIIDAWGGGRRLWGLPLYPEEVRGAKTLEPFWQGSFRIEHPATIQEPPGPPFAVDPPAPMPEAGLRLLVFAGKGGVGKTTLACATALHLAQAYPRRRILLFSSDPAHSLADCLDMPVGAEPTSIGHGLTAMEVDAMAEFSALKSTYGDELDSFFSELTPGLDFTFDRRVMQQMMDFAPPGVDEIAALSRAVVFLREGDYGLFVLDAAPSGHLIRLLELPALLDDWLKAMFDLLLKYKEVLGVPRFARRLVQLSRDLKFFRALLADPARTAVHLIAVPTEMACAETGDLADNLRRADLRLQQLFLNLCTPPSPCALCSALHRRENRAAERCRSSLPGVLQSRVFLGPEPRGVDALTALGKALYLEHGDIDNRGPDNRVGQD